MDVDIGAKIKVLRHKHIVAVKPIACSDCKGMENDYFKILCAGVDQSERIVCYNCLLESGKYAYKDSFLLIDAVQKGESRYMEFLAFAQG